MKFKVIPAFITSLLTFLLVGCNSKTAFDYNEKIVSIESRITAQKTFSDNMLSNYFQNGNYDSVAILSDKMEKLVDKELQQIIKEPAPNVKEGQNFKDAAVRYFQYLKDIYTSYKKVAAEKTDDGRLASLKDAEKLEDKQEAVLDDIQSAQKKFATANGFKIKD